jgi:hypothetical protein
VNVEVQAVAVGAELGKELICQMISVCAGETTLGHVIMWILIIVLIGVVFHGPHGRRLSTQLSFTKGKLPLPAPIAPATL